MPSTYLTLTPDGGGNQRKFTFSVWCKKSAINPASSYFLFGTGTSSNYTHLYFDSNHNLVMKGRASSSTFCEVISERKFRDENAFYHIVCAVDTEQGTAADRVKMYVNGVQETQFLTATYPGQNADFENQSASAPFKIGTNYNNTADESFSGLMTHFHYVDGTQLTPATFGETDSVSGIWKPKSSPTGITYGTNGFFLKFENSGAMGTDSSGESNTFAVNGTMTQNVDTPSNVFCTLNSLTGNCTLTNGNLSWDATPSSYGHNAATFGVSAGKWYWEHKPANACASIGITDFDWEMQKRGAIIYAASGQSYSYEGNGYVSHNSYGDMSSSYASYTTEVIGVALDLTNNKLYFSKSGVWNNSADPANNTNGLAIDAPSTLTGGVYSPLVADLCSATVATGACNFGQGFFGTTAVSSANADANGHGAFEYTVPNGFYALCTKNLKEFG
jgi:hypothetical protein